MAEEARQPAEEPFFDRAYVNLWAKTDASGATHPLVCHLIDVGFAALTLWQHALTDSTRARVAGALGLAQDECGRLLAFWAALHDVGKASPSFQRKYAAALPILTGAGFTFPRLIVNETVGHATVTAATLGALLTMHSGLPKREARRIAATLGGHHGLWPSAQTIGTVKDDQLGRDSPWQNARDALVHVLRELLQPPPLQSLGASEEEENALLMFLSGLTSVADWIGSMAEYFPFCGAFTKPADYAAGASGRAVHALTELEWLGWRPKREPARFEDLFTFLPNPVQSALIQLAPALATPSLVIVETPTGSGKTEGALWLADTWNATLQQRGIYVAMPTMATSNQMFARTKTFLRTRYPDVAIEPLLLHGQAQWRVEQPPPALNVADEDRPAAHVLDQSWFLQRKRGLLAPFGVGTVDQTLLAVLQARHFFVRLWGLAGKTVIFDEVHAYDTYMSTLFQRLLEWLHALGSSVILLSATLPNETRKALVAAYSGSAQGFPEKSPYPALTVASAGGVTVHAVPWDEERTVALEWADRSPETLVKLLRDRLAEGGCAAVICNTVGRAQAIHAALLSAALVEPEELTLFHARYPAAWRDEIEAGVLSCFGKEGRRPRRAIVVATQVIEQSLDLDFDFMVSDLAPVDLLIQRAGRLHRHQRAARPAALVRPTLVVAVDHTPHGLPEFGNDSFVYDRYVLLRSYWALSGRTGWRSPEDISPLIESVYSDEPLSGATGEAALADLARARVAFDAAREQEVAEAKVRLVRAPRDEDLLELRGVGLEEDTPALHKSLQALTRLGPPSVEVVCLFATESGLNTEPDGSGMAVDLARLPDNRQTRMLALASVSLSHRGLVGHLLQWGSVAAPGWTKHPLLRNRYPLIFEKGECRLDGLPYLLRLSRTYGLEISKEVA